MTKISKDVLGRIDEMARAVWAGSGKDLVRFAVGFGFDAHHSERFLIDSGYKDGEVQPKLEALAGSFCCRAISGLVDDVRESDKQEKR